MNSSSQHPHPHLHAHPHGGHGHAHPHPHPHHGHGFGTPPATHRVPPGAAAAAAAFAYSPHLHAGAAGGAPGTPPPGTYITTPHAALDPSLQALSPSPTTGRMQAQAQAQVQVQQQQVAGGQQRQGQRQVQQQQRQQQQSQAQQRRKQVQANNAAAGGTSTLTPRGRRPQAQAVVDTPVTPDVTDGQPLGQDTPMNGVDGANGTTQNTASDGTRPVLDPPFLDNWRQRLFDVDGVLVLSEEQFKTYFPHVDNVYSHRSTQKYKRKPFVSHYWDCRLKGRPPGTPKSDDPTKKKRKRAARERDLCDVKIKITEYHPGARSTMRQTGERPNDGSREAAFVITPDGQARPAPDRGDNLPGADGSRYYTICRVSGSPWQPGEETTPCRHRHTLEESDRIKKSSVQREVLKHQKNKKQGQKTYHKKCTGQALVTAKKHAKEHDFKMYGSCFCPFVQRLWIALEHKGLGYQYIEVDPYKKPASLLALNPLGLVPAVQHGDFSCHESSVLLEYLEDAFPSSPLLPSSAGSRATQRLWADHISKKIIPCFYRTLQAQEPSKQAAAASELRQGIETLVKAADPTGPFFAGASLGYVDVVLAPWMLRLARVLKPYRGWPDAEPGTRWGKWLQAVEENEAVKNTTSTDDLYLESYERYAENRPGTSQVADAVNQGRGLP